MRTLTLSAILLLCASAHAIGNRTHAEISERAADLYCTGPQAMVPGLAEFMADPELRKALFSGSTFPDWGYGNENADAAEQAHWTPFHRGFFDYLRERLPADWSAEEKKNIAFFLGDVSHSVADIPWHFNGQDPSFLDAAKNAEGSTHLDCDTGSDVFLMQREGIVPDLSYADFYWPADLLREVYAKAGRTVPADTLKFGGMRQQGYWVLAKSVSDLTIASFQKRCPWIGANMDGYYNGGIDHDAAAVSIWIKYYFARLRGDYFFQNVPEYGTKPPEWDGYHGCTDTVLSPARADSNGGGEPVLELTSGPQENASVLLLRFDISEIPADKAIGAATLWLAAEAVAQSGPLEVSIAPCKETWTAGTGRTDAVSGTSGVKAEGGEATWGSYPTGQLAWQPATLTSATQGWYTLDVTALVKAWTSGAAANHGLALRRSAGANVGPLRLLSSEAWKTPSNPPGGTRVAQRPALVIQAAP